MKESTALTAVIITMISFLFGMIMLELHGNSYNEFKVGECIVDSTIPPWDKNNVYMVSKVLQTSENHVQLTQAPYYLGDYTMKKTDLQNYEVVSCPPVELLPEEAGEECGH